MSKKPRSSFSNDSTDFSCAAKNIHEFLRAREQYEQEVDDSSVFSVFRHLDTTSTRQRPLVVIIHPGDMVEQRASWTAADWSVVGSFSLANQQGSADELRAWRQDGADFVILHRSSCVQISTMIFRQGRREPISDIDHRFANEIGTAWISGTVLYGDDLELASEWMCANLNLAARPAVFLAGAYSDPDSGCLTFIGRRIVREIGPERVQVSKWSPPGNCPGSTWDPMSDTHPLSSSP